MAIDTQVLRFIAKGDFRAFNAAVTKAGKLQDKYQKTALKGTEKTDKATRQLGADLRKYDNAVQKVARTHEQRMKLITRYQDQVEDFEKALLTATKTEADDIRRSMDILEKKYKLAVAGATGYQKELARIHDQNKELSKLEDERRIGALKDIKAAKDLLTVREAIEDMHKRSESRRQSMISDVAGFGGHEMREGFEESFKDAISSVSSRDFGGFASSMMKAMGTAAKGAGGALTRAAAGGAGGGGGGAMAKMLSSIGPTLNMLAKFGPILMTVSSALMAVVKLFLDADAAAKDFNKQVLETTSTSGFLSKNFGNAAAAAEDVRDTMKDMYDQATSLDNIGWGISKETHAQVESALGAQGVMLDKTKEYFKSLKEGRAQAQGTVKDWGTMVQMSVGYSRAFGVSLSEVTDLQGELMSELGMSFDDVESGFQKMVQGADDAGIASNKFFQQMRGISADLSLFNLRIEDAAKIMSKLDKAMSPRKAAQFFQTITGFFKGMGLMDRAKMVLMAGTGQTKGILRKDLNQTEQALAAKLDEHGKGLGQEFKDSLGKKGQLIKFLAKHDKELSGEERDAIMTASRQEQKLQRGGIIDLASALKDASPFAAMDEIEAMSKRMFQKPIEDLSGVQLAAVEQAAGINDEQIDQFAKLRGALDTTQEQIAQKIEDGTKLTDEEASMLHKLGINYKDGAKDQEAADAFRHKDSKAVWDNMNKTQQDSLRDSAGTLDQAKRQGDITQSITDKLGVLMDFIMRQIYDVLNGVWEAILDMFNFWPFKGKSHDFDKATIKASKTRDQRLIKAFSDAGGDINKAKGGIVSTVGKDFMDNLKSAGDEWKKLNDGIAKEQDPEKKKAMQKRIDELSQKKAEDTHKILGAMTNDQIVAALKDAGQKDPALMKIADAMEASVDETGTMTRGFTDQDLGGLSSDQINELLGKSMWAMTPDQLTDVIPGLNFATAGAQQKASDTSAPAPPPAAAAAPTPAAAAAPPSAAQAAGAPSSAKTITPGDLQDATDAQGKNIQGTMDDMQLEIRKQSGGVVFNGPYLKNQYGGQIEDSVYNAASRALFEYWMYQDTDRGDALKAIQAGMNPRMMGQAFFSAVTKGGATLGQEGTGWQKVAEAAPHAEGGVVMRPPAGEAFTSVKPGERIVPAGGGGGGGGTIRLELVGDLKRIIRAETLNTLNEHNRVARLR